MRWLALVGCLLFLLGCGNKQPYLGTWKTQDGSAVLSFNSDGTLVAGMGQSGSKSGTWKNAGDHLLEVKLEGATAPDTTRWQVSDDSKTLTLTPQDGSTAITYLRQ